MLTRRLTLAQGRVLPRGVPSPEALCSYRYMEREAASRGPAAVLRAETSLRHNYLGGPPVAPCSPSTALCAKGQMLVLGSWAHCAIPQNG